VRPERPPANSIWATPDAGNFTKLFNSGLGKDVNHVLAQFIADCQAGMLPAVSWIVGPFAYTEHPIARPVDGAVYIQRVLDAVWANPKLAASTVVFINYDENDGFFDHLPPPTPPQGTPDEFLPAFQPGFRGSPPPSGPLVPIGLGPRVPMTVVSPWSQGGFVDSQVFDHTSVLRFLELWTGVREPNISAWRRAICGDLTSCFDFAEPRFIAPLLPNTAALRLQADQTKSKLPAPAPPPLGQQSVPVQAAGSVPARALPYQPLADVELTGVQLDVRMSNRGKASLQLVVYAVHDTNEDVLRFDLSHDASTSTSVTTDPLTGAYNVAIHGPNGFLRRANGSVLGAAAGVEAALRLVGDGDEPELKLVLRNQTTRSQTVQVTGLRNAVTSFSLTPKRVEEVDVDSLEDNHGWYELMVTVEGDTGYVRVFAGHIETGEASRTSAS